MAAPSPGFDPPVKLPGAGRARPSSADDDAAAYFDAAASASAAAWFSSAVVVKPVMVRALRSGAMTRAVGACITCAPLVIDSYWPTFATGTALTTTRPWRRFIAATARLTARSSEPFEFQKRRTTAFLPSTARRSGAAGSVLFAAVPRVASRFLAGVAAGFAAVDGVVVPVVVAAVPPVAFCTLAFAASLAFAAPLAAFTSLARPVVPGAAGSGALSAAGALGLSAGDPSGHTAGQATRAERE